MSDMNERAKRRLDELNRGYLETIQGVVDDGKVEVAEVAEEGVTVICGLVEEGFPEPFTDNKHAPCLLCGRTVMYRPYISEKVAKMCMPCAAESMTATQN